MPGNLKARTRGHLPWWLSGAMVVFAILATTGLPLFAMLLEAGSIELNAALNDTYLQRVLLFSVKQATASTLLSLGLALPVALALSHEPRFPGRSLLVTLFSLSLVIPTIVAIFGIVAVFGRTGWVNQALAIVSLPGFSLYGLNGILLAHVFFNMPLAARVMLQALEGVPGEQWRLANQLGMGPVARFRHIEWPNLLPQLAPLAVLIFTLCFTSFAIVMTLGGGPRATTIEVAIYQALRFDFDLTTAVTLACIQLILCTSLMVLSSLLPSSTETSLTFSRGASNARWRPRQTHRLPSILIIAFATGFILLPLLGLALSALNPAAVKVIADPTTQRAVLNTLIAALSSACLAVLAGIGLLASTRHLRIRLAHDRIGRHIQLLGNLILVFPPLVLGTGLFLLLRPYADVFSIALSLVITINSLMALPFVLRILDAPMIQVARGHDHLLMSLGISGWNRWRLIDWPQLRRPLGLCLAVSATLAAGDLSAIALFGSERVTTLPLLLYQRMGSYRLEEAAVTAGLLLMLCLVMFAGLQRLVGGKSHA